MYFLLQYSEWKDKTANPRESQPIAFRYSGLSQAFGLFVAFARPSVVLSA